MLLPLGIAPGPHVMKPTTFTLLMLGSPGSSWLIRRIFPSVLTTCATGAPVIAATSAAGSFSSTHFAQSQACRAKVDHGVLGLVMARGPSRQTGS